MGFHVETAEMKKALEQYQKLSKTAQEQLNNAKNSMNGIIKSNAMHGQVGQAIAADINNNKNAVLVGLKNSYKLVEADLQKTYADFAGTTGETSQSAVLDEAVITKAKTAIDKFKTEHKEKRQAIKSTYNDIADLISLSMPSSSTFTSACDEAKKHLDKIIQKVNEFDSKQPPSSTEEIINVLSQQIKMSETASGLSYTDPRFMEFVSQTGLAESIQDIDSQIAQAEADAKLAAEKAAKEKQEQWAKDHPLENALRNFTDGIGSWWNGIVKGTKGLNTEGFLLLETGKGILLVLESTIGFVGEGISSLAIGSIQVGQLLGGGLAAGINNQRGVKSPDWIGKDWSGAVKNVQALTPEAIFEMSKAAIGAMADDFKRGDIYDMTTDILTVGTMLSAANGLKNTAKNVTTKLRAPKVGSVVGDVAKGANRFKPKKVTLNNGEIVYKSKDGILVRSADYLDEAGNIKWPKHNGFYLDEFGKPIMKNANIKKGQILDRYGDSGGTFTSPVENGKVLNYDSRGLPYPESVMDYHKYEVVKDINIKNVQQGFDNLSLVDQKELHRLMNKYHFNLGDMANPQSGIVSEVFGSGGGTQIKLGTSVSWYEKLGILKEIK